MRTYTHFTIMVAVGMGSLGWAATSHAEVEWTLAASSEETAPGGGNARFERFRFVHLAENGNLAWIANLEGGPPNQVGVWRNIGNGAEAVLVDPATVEGLDGQVRIDTSVPPSVGAPGPYIDEDGNVTLSVWRPVAGDAILTGSAENWRVVAAVGASAPGTDAAFAELQAFYTVAPGVVAFEATLSGDTVTDRNKESIWVWTDGELELLMRTGDPAPGFPGQFFDPMMKPQITALNEAGRVLFAALRTGDASVNRRALWSGTSPDDIELHVALDPPAREGKAVFDLMASTGQYTHQITDDGQILIGSSTSSTAGIWTLEGRQPTLLFGAGGFVPGLGPDYTFDRLQIRADDVFDTPIQPSFSPAGRIAFTATAYSEREADGVWSGDAAGARLLVWDKEAFDGIEEATPHAFKYLETNDRGQVLLDTTSTIEGSSAMRHLLVRYTPSEGFERILMPDDAIDSDGTSRVVTAFEVPCSPSAFAQPAASCQDKDGRIVVSATFSDGTIGLLVTNAQAPGKPEAPQDAPVTSGTGGSVAGGHSSSGSGASGFAGRAAMGGSGSSIPRSGGSGEGGSGAPDDNESSAGGKDSSGCSVAAIGAPVIDAQALLILLLTLDRRRRRTRESRLRSNRA